MKLVKMILLILLLSVTIFDIYLYAKINATTDKNIYLVYNNNLKQTSDNFNISDFNKLKKTVDFPVSFEVIKALPLSNGIKTFESKVVLTNSEYQFIHSLYYISGCFWDYYHESLRKQVVVVNESLAFELFGTGAVIGEKILVNNIPCKIIGVIRDSLKGSAELYAPYYIENNISVLQNLTFQFNNESDLDSTIEIEDFMNKLSLDYNDFELLTTHGIIESAFIKLKSLCILIIFYFIYALVRNLVGNIRYMHSHLQTGLKNDYPLSYIKKNILYLIHKTIKCLFYTIIIIIILVKTDLMGYIDKFEIQSFTNNNVYTEVSDPFFHLFMQNNYMFQMFWLGFILYIIFHAIQTTRK